MRYIKEPLTELSAKEKHNSIFAYAKTMATQNPDRYFKHDRKSHTRNVVWLSKLLGKSTLPSTDIKHHTILSILFLMGVAP
jgi:hypothetical protein